MYSAYKLNKQGDNMQPWCTPFPIGNQSVVPCPTGSQRTSLRVLRWLQSVFGGSFSWWGVIWSYPYYHHIDAVYDFSMYYQLSNSFCLCQGQQATHTRIYKTTANHGKYHSPLNGHCHKDSEAWDLQDVPLHPISAGSSQIDLNIRIPKELGLLSLERRMLGRYNKKKEPRMAVAKRQRK